MNPEDSELRDKADSRKRIDELVQGIIAAEQELEQLVGGDLDAFLNTKGEPVFFSEGQKRLHQALIQHEREKENLQAILDALSLEIALLDETGVILTVNRAWKDFADSNQFISENPEESYGVGKNYIEVCKEAEEAQVEDAAVIRNGLIDVIEGQLDLFSHEYPCHSPDQKRWFRLEITPFKGVNKRGAVVSHSNITTRVAAVHDLRRRERLLRSAPRLAEVGSWEHTFKPDRLWWSEETYQIFGLKGVKPDNLFAEFISRVLPEDLEALEEAQKVALTTGSLEIAYRIKRPDGEIRYLLERGEVEYDSNGEPLKRVGMVRDRTDEVIALESLKESDRIRTLSNRLVNMGGWSVDLIEGVVTWSDEVARIHDLPPGYALSLDEALNFYPPEWRIKIESLFKDCAELGKPFDAELQILTAKKRLIWVRSVGEAERDSKGNIFRVTGAFMDISESKKNLEQIEEQARMLNESNNVIFVMDLQGRIKFWNRGAENDLGWAETEVLDSLAQSLLEIDRDQWDEAMCQVLKEDFWEGEFVKKTKKAKSKTHAINWTLLRDPFGEPKSVLNIGADVTDNKKLERELHQVQRLESVGRLAGGIAHDLNNVLSPILLSSDLLSKKVSDSASQESLKIIQSCALRGAALVKQVLSFSRKVDGRPEILDPNEQIEEVVGILRETFPKDIAVKVKATSKSWKIRGDSTQIHQILMNLCVNARDALPQGGEITLGVENVEIDETYASLNPAANQGSYVAFQIIDNGIGMTPEVQENAFDPFFTTKEVGSGTGLGLSTSRGIVHSNGGFINVYSEPERGTSIHVYWPAVETEKGEVRQISSNSEPRKGNGELILVVDDENLILRTVQKALERNGYRTVAAENGAIAVSILAERKEEISLVLTDLAMPIMDGPATIVAMKRIDPELPIVASSGIALDGRTSKAANAGVKYFIPKPYSEDNLLKIIQEALADKKGGAAQSS